LILNPGYVNLQQVRVPGAVAESGGFAHPLPPLVHAAAAVVEEVVEAAPLHVYTRPVEEVVELAPFFSTDAPGLMHAYSMQAATLQGIIFLT